MAEEPDGTSIIRYAVSVMSAAVSMTLFYYCFKGSKSYRTGWQHASFTFGVVVLGVCVALSAILAVRYSDLYARWTKPLPRTDPDEESDNLRPTSPEQDHRTY